MLTVRHTHHAGGIFLDDRFPTDQPLAETDQSAVAPLDQLSAETPLDDASPPDPQAELTRIQGERDQAAQRADAAERQAQMAQAQIEQHQRQIAENAARQWQQAEAELHAAIPEMEPDQAVKITREFYAARERQLLGTYQQQQASIQQERIAAFAEFVAKEKGLDPNDAHLLLSTPGAFQNPNVMVNAADSLKQSRERGSSETKRLQKELDDLKRLVAGNGLQQGLRAGGNGSAPSSSAFDVKSPDYDLSAHLHALEQHARMAN